MRNVERFKYNNIIKQYYKNSLINIHDRDDPRTCMEVRLC